MDDEIKNLPPAKDRIINVRFKRPNHVYDDKDPFWVGYDEQPLKVLNRQRLVDYTSSGAIAMMSREIAQIDSELARLKEMFGSMDKIEVNSDGSPGGLITCHGTASTHFSYAKAFLKTILEQEQLSDDGKDFILLMAGEFFQAGFNIGANNGISDLWKSRAYASDAFKARANNPKKLFLQNEARRLAKELWEADSDKEITTGKMAELIAQHLLTRFPGHPVPGNQSIRRWINDIKPEWASNPGRQ